MKLFTSLLLVLTLVSSCTNRKLSTDSEHMLISELVLLRTEGLALVEFVQTKSTNADVLSMCQKLQRYYESTHPEFLHVCAEKKINLNNQDFELMWKKMSERFSAGGYSVEQTCLRLCAENIASSIRLYEDIIQKRNNEEMAYFSFIALPDLYNHQHDLERLKGILATAY